MRLSMPLTYNVCNDSLHVHTKWLAEARGRGEGQRGEERGGGGAAGVVGGRVSSFRFNYKIRLTKI